MIQPCRPTAVVRCIHTSELSLNKQLVSRMARLCNAGVFLPTILHRGTHRNTIELSVCARELLFDSFGRSEKWSYSCLPFLPAGGATFIPMRARGLCLIRWLPNARADVRARWPPVRPPVSGVLPHRYVSNFYEVILLMRRACSNC